MKIQEAMVLWSQIDAAKQPGAPQIQVVSHPGDGKFGYLAKSDGACWGDWRRADPAKLATHLLGVFVRAVVRDGVPVEEAQREFLKIDEYREWFESASGPFQDAHFAWSRIGDAPWKP